MPQITTSARKAFSMSFMEMRCQRSAHPPLVTTMCVHIVWQTSYGTLHAPSMHGSTGSGKKTTKVAHGYRDSRRPHAAPRLSSGTPAAFDTTTVCPTLDSVPTCLIRVFGRALSGLRFGPADFEECEVYLEKKVASDAATPGITNGYAVPSRTWVARMRLHRKKYLYCKRSRICSFAEGALPGSIHRLP